ncbi:hypothetical protein ENLAB_16870 [Enterococcus innesii]|uniref:NAD(P)-binding domain-containing protein n=1 Tax=Enterococcus innesii TaxID=2839759 RepID=A0ABM7XSS4_9ENTE|nr:hypothetical protein ENLAB_16870 [Enterococcus innesii]
MQTILGSNGQIGYELAKELYKNYTNELRLVSRKPQKINPTDQLVSADLMDFSQTKKAIEHSEIVYFTVGLPMDAELWETNFMIITENVIRACQEAQSKLVFLIILICIQRIVHPNRKTRHFLQQAGSPSYALKWLNWFYPRWKVAV